MARWVWNEDDLLPAERAVVEALRAGDWDEVGVIRIGEGDLPAENDEGRRLRAEVVHALALERETGVPLPDTGLRLGGGLIQGRLSFEGATLDRDLGLAFCRFDAEVVFRSARLRNLLLDGADLPSLTADRLETRGGVFLRGVTVRGEARLNGAKIGGNLACDCATFVRKNGYALNADRLEARGNVVLRGATVRGEARLNGAKIGGNLACDCATFVRKEGHALNADRLETRGGVFVRGAKVRGEARLNGAKIGGDLTCVGATFDRPGGVALRADGAQVAGALFLRPDDEGTPTRINGCLDLSDASFGAINDAESCWPTKPGELRLDRCRYGAFTGGPVTAEARLRWLALQDPATVGEDFWPQPYEQLAKVLREMGHGADAREVLIAKERLQRADRRKRMPPMRRALRWFFDGLMGVTTLYGRQPLLAFAWLLVFWLLGAGFFHDARTADALKPNTPFVLRAAEWTQCAENGARRGAHASQLACFEAQPEAASYPRFNAWVYSADTLLPVVSLEMQSFWIPDESADWIHAARTRIYLWLHIALGWALSLLAVAGFSGLVKSD